MIGRNGLWMRARCGAFRCFLFINFFLLFAHFSITLPSIHSAIFSRHILALRTGCPASAVRGNAGDTCYAEPRKLFS